MRSCEKVCEPERAPTADTVPVEEAVVSRKIDEVEPKSLASEGKEQRTVSSTQNPNQNRTGSDNRVEFSDQNRPRGGHRSRGGRASGGGYNRGRGRGGGAEKRSYGDRDGGGGRRSGYSDWRGGRDEYGSSNSAADRTGGRGRGTGKSENGSETRSGGYYGRRDDGRSEQRRNKSYHSDGYSDYDDERFYKRRDGRERRDFYRAPKRDIPATNGDVSSSDLQRTQDTGVREIEERKNEMRSEFRRFRQSGKPSTWKSKQSTSEGSSVAQTQGKLERVSADSEDFR